jgi:hypothetical protein
MMFPQMSARASIAQDRDSFKPVLICQPTAWDSSKTSVRRAPPAGRLDLHSLLRRTLLSEIYNDENMVNQLASVSRDERIWLSFGGAIAHELS